VDDEEERCMPERCECGHVLHSSEEVLSGQCARCRAACFDEAFAFDIDDDDHEDEKSEPVSTY